MTPQDLDDTRRDVAVLSAAVGITEVVDARAERGRQRVPRADDVRLGILGRGERDVGVSHGVRTDRPPGSVQLANLVPGEHGAGEHPV